jgi:hypothetical protein
MQDTWLPVSAKQVPVTKPTYPVPTTAIFINLKFQSTSLIQRVLDRQLFLNLS